MPKKPVFIEHQELPGESPRPLVKKNKKTNRISLKIIREIYAGRGADSDFTRLEQGKGKSRTVILGLLVFFAALALAAWAGFFIFQPYGRFVGRGVVLTIEGEEKVKAGEVQEYHFFITSKERQALAALEARLVIPKEFQVLEARPAPTKEPYTWVLGRRDPASRDEIVLRGYFYGPDEGASAFQAMVTYRPVNFNADFQAIATKQIILAGTVFETKLVGPTEVTPGEEIEYEYALKNTGSESFEPVARLEAGPYFLFSSSEPASKDEGGKEWKIAALAPGTESRLFLKGKFAGDAVGLASLTLMVGLVKGDEYFAHSRQNLEVNVLAPVINLTLLVNGSTENRVADFGDRLHLSLAYSNPGETTLGEVVISLVASEDPTGLIDWSGLETAAKPKQEGQVLIWTRREIAGLASLAPRAEGVIDLILPISTAVASLGNDEIRFSVGALIGAVDGRPNARQIQTTPLIIALNTDLNFKAEARYFDEDGASLGSGPLPPRVGESTNLRIVWIIENTRHGLQNLRLKTTLPGRVSWTGRTRVETGRLSWEAANRIVTWQIDNLTRETNKISADFEVQIIPDSSDLGRFLTLTNETTLEARDTKTGAAVSRRAGSLNTDMPSDPSAAGKGVVSD